MVLNYTGKKTPTLPGLQTTPLKLQTGKTLARYHLGYYFFMNAKSHFESKEPSLPSNTSGKSWTLPPCDPITVQADPTSTVTLHIYSLLSTHGCPLHTSWCFSLLLVLFLQLNFLVSLQTEVTQLFGGLAAGVWLWTDWRGDGDPPWFQEALSYLCIKRVSTCSSCRL